MAELILHHARANQCQDIERFKAEMAELVTKFRGNTIALGKASAPCHILTYLQFSAMWH